MDKLCIEMIESKMGRTNHAAFQHHSVFISLFDLHL